MHDALGGSGHDKDFLEPKGQAIVDFFDISDGTTLGEKEAGNCAEAVEELRSRVELLERVFVFVDWDKLPVPPATSGVCVSARSEVGKGSAQGP